VCSIFPRFNGITSLTWPLLFLGMGSATASGLVAEYDNYGINYNCPVQPTIPAGNIFDTAAKYFGRPYSSSPRQAAVDLASGESFDCTTFITRALLDQGYLITNADVKWININEYDSRDEMELDVRNRGALSAGVVSLLHQTHRGFLIDRTEDLERGDIVQFWYEKPDGKLGGHSGIVDTVLSDGRVTLLGAHGTYGSGSVGLKTYDLREGDYNGRNKVISAYAVRPLGNLLQKRLPQPPSTRGFPLNTQPTSHSLFVEERSVRFLTGCPRTACVDGDFTSARSTTRPIEVELNDRASI
jgi:hypothetical protein